MTDFLPIENKVFDSLDDYIDDIRSACSSKYKEGQLDHLPQNLFKIREEGKYSIFFLCAEPLLEILKDPNFSEQLKALKEEGFFLLTPVKTNVAIGKGYEVSYCRNDARIISKNLNNYGYVFITTTSSLTKVEDDLILCQVVGEPTEEQGKLKGRRLVELFPGLFIFFNVKSSHQALVLDLEKLNC
jgi:hypothetical protein